MATFAQFRELLEQGELKRLYFVYGAERVLVEEAADLIRARMPAHDLDYVSLSAASTDDAKIWAQVNQYPLVRDGRRLVVVRDAEAVASWQPLLQWVDSRLIPGVTVILVSNEREVDTSEANPHLYRFAHANAVRIVKCARQSRQDAERYLTRRFGMEDADARKLLDRLGGDLLRAANVGAQARALGRVDARVLGALSAPAPDEDFVSHLLALRKREAMEAVERVAPERARGIISVLDSKLADARQVRRAMRVAQSALEVSRSTGVPVPRVKELERVAPNYDESRTRRCVRALALADAATASGESAGVLETLVTLW